jgi:regulation of enolase protein 1 (concanavalin A-like superfamily)
MLDEPSTRLRIARIGDAYAFHASRDAKRWDLVRHFRLEAANVQVGFEAQSPFGDGLTARFSEISFEARTLTDLRDGS